jgi:hypothetical protein
MTSLDRNDAEGIGSFDFALGIHEAFLDRAAWAVYESGLLCATVDSSVIDVLDSDTLSLLIPSMVDLLGDEVAPVSLVLRPQSPPDITVSSTSLLELSLPNLIMDFYAMVDERSVRLFSASFDLTLPLGLEIDGTGAIIPTIGKI